VYVSWKNKNCFYILQDFKDYAMYDIFKMYGLKYILKYKLQIKL